MVSDGSSPGEKQSQEAVTPRDAASLVLVRDGARGPEVLMGKRPDSSRFMPGVYVFPGGGVEEDDYKLETEFPLPGHVVERMARQSEEPLARALAWAAVRETWEETGILLGAPGPAHNPRNCETLSAYDTAGLAPDLTGLDYLMRAVTPPYLPIRFNTRFFIVDAGQAQGRLEPRPELEHVTWHSIEEALDLHIINVTAIVLNAACDYWQERPKPNASRPSPMFTQYEPGEIILRDE